MTSLLNRLFGRARRGSGATAKDRLRFVLQHDRINLPPERMDEMKREILAVIVKYLVVDKDRVEIALEQRDRTHSKLVAEIPFAIETSASSRIVVENSPAASESADVNGSGNGADADAADDNSEEEAAIDDAEEETAADDEDEEEKEEDKD